jgi:hypothetical protein
MPFARVLKNASLALAILVATWSPLTAAAERRSGLCDWGLGLGNRVIDPMLVPEGSNSYIIECMTADKCSALAKSLLKILGDSGDVNVLQTLGILTGRFDSSIIRLLCMNADYQNLIGGIELDAIVGYD